MASMVSSVYNFFSSSRTAFSSVLLLGTPSLGKYIFKEQYDQQWKWPVSILMLGIATLSIGKDKKMPLVKSCLISLALSSIGHAIAYYAFPQPIRESNVTLGEGKLAISEALHRFIVLIKTDSQKGSGVLVKDNKLGYVFITVKHVVTPGATAYIEGVEISLDCLKWYESGSDILLFAIDDIFEDQDEAAIPMTLVNAQLQIGEKVYFGGYPFNEMRARLHMGHISSIGRKGEISIDGVAVPGMSGGPIAVERNGRLVVIGAVASETFDPIEGFPRALGRMYADQSDAQVRSEFARNLKEESWEHMLSDPQFTKITRENLYIGWLDHLRESDPDCFKNMWDDLNKRGVISDDGGIDPAKIIPGQLGLREKYQKFEEDIIKRLKASTTGLTEMNPEDIQLPFETEMPTDPINTVSLSLVQSLSTGLITGHLFQEYRSEDPSAQSQESTEFEIGKGNRVAKNKKKLEKKARKLRAEAKQSDSFVNVGVPKILYRYVSKEDVKSIKKDGIVHSGEELDEIPFLIKASKKMALSVGAVSTEKLVAVYPDRIPGLAQENVGKVSERNGVITYRINLSIPKEAIEISEA